MKLTVGVNCFYFILTGSEIILYVAENMSLKGLYGFILESKSLQLVSSILGVLVVFISTRWFTTCSSKMSVYVWVPVYAPSSLGSRGNCPSWKSGYPEFGAFPPDAGRGMAGWLSRGSCWCHSQQMGGFLGFVKLGRWVSACEQRVFGMCLGGWLFLRDKSAVTHRNRAFLLTEDMLVGVHGIDNFSYIL